MKTSNLSIDEVYANEISSLLKPLPALQIQEYFDDLIQKRRCNGLKVKQNGELGKGVYAVMKFEEEELILQDQMIVGAQHSSNKMDCLVCSFCFRFIGSVELQIGRKLYLQEMASSNECHSSCSDGEDDSCMKNHDNAGECSTSSSANKIPLAIEIVDSLMNGALRLPCVENFSLPSTIPCAGGCGEAYYCSKPCADMDWEHCHSLLCTGDKSLSACKKALSKFVDHANDTNDIFLVAAKAISFTILRYRKLKQGHLKNIRHADARVIGNEAADLPLLLEAWKPISMGYKRKWWECIALPHDVDESDEVVFRAQIKEMAFTSLQLLKEAIFEKECAPLFSLEIYGNIIGMFELNNLDLVVASPVENYFLHIDDLPSSKKKEAEAITKPILDALGEDYSVYCEGDDFWHIYRRYQPQHDRRPDRGRLKFKVPTLDVRWDPDSYMDWEATVEHIWSRYDVHEYMNVHLVTLAFDAYVKKWWNVLIKEKKRVLNPPGSNLDSYESTSSCKVHSTTLQRCHAPTSREFEARGYEGSNANYKT